MRNLPVHQQQGSEVRSYQRAPTLLGTPGSAGRGPVQVWAPSRFRSGLAVATPVLLAVYGIFVEIHERLIPLAILIGLASLFGVIRLLIALRRPCYVTTDDSGIAITTRTGSRSLLWSEIRRATLIQADRVEKIRLFAPDLVEIILVGYGRKQQRRLRDLIADRAHLSPLRLNRNIYLPAGDPVHGSSYALELDAPKPDEAP